MPSGPQSGSTQCERTRASSPREPTLCGHAAVHTVYARSEHLRRGKAGLQVKIRGVMYEDLWLGRKGIKERACPTTRR